jgi:tRNA(Arg) A34 adenosine deaminase TadA
MAMKRFVNIALKKARGSTHKCHLMASLVIRGGAILSSATNLRGNSSNFHQSFAPLWHAEKRALMPHFDFSGATLIVVRIGNGCSRPCPNCYEAIKAAGIKKVGYVNEDRMFVVEKVV